MPKTRERAQANLENLYRIFTVPEAPDSTLGTIDQAISDDLSSFLQDHIVALEREMEEIEADFTSSTVPEEPTYVSDYTEFLKEKLVAQSVHTASPGFVGHMTTAIPYFMLPLARIMTALNQNLVKVETSKAFTPMERQVLAMLHRLVYEQSDEFYNRSIHDSDHALGAFCSGGTVANITALWAARNKLFAPSGDFKGIAQEGLIKSLQHIAKTGLAVLASKRAHYSLGKAADLLGIGRENLIRIETDENNRIDLNLLKEQCKRLEGEGIHPLSLIGIAGTTETGNVDPLHELADLALELDCHFHIDAAWGGPTLFSNTYGKLLSGIERADSVTLDAHKQLYVPMGAGMVVFKDPTTLKAIEHHAAYILRKGAKDLGSHTLEGSRPGMAMLVHAGLSIIGRKGYELLMDRGIEIARRFADRIEKQTDFELVSKPELNILTYRYNPEHIQTRLQQALIDDPELAEQINEILGQINRELQKHQRAAGKSFVSRTSLTMKKYNGTIITVFRVVLANPLTTDEILADVLKEQSEIVKEEPIATMIEQLNSIF